MNAKYLNLIMHDAAAFTLNCLMFYVLYTINAKISVAIAALYGIKLLASYLYVQEKKNEDKAMIEEFDKLLNIKDNDNV